MKFAGKLEAGYLLGVLLANYLSAILRSVPDVIVPVPLHRGRLRARGFNQALEVARPVARELGVHINPGLVRRVRATRSQAGIRVASERRLNVRGAFEVRRDLDAVRYAAVVDDVVTTGATCGELVRELKRRGVERVDVWSAARA